MGVLVVLFVDYIHGKVSTSPISLKAAAIRPFFGIYTTLTGAVLIASTSAIAVDMKDNILSSRLLSSGFDSYKPGLTQPDIFYPEWYYYTAIFID